ncbi:MAG: putative Ig domain-containing protein, partial [Verrucomicrobiota bacterium]|nr:putative Ig domain-containing protein [Verrucomicrobiota bacterium]
NVGQGLTYQITANNSPTSYGATGLPAGLSVDEATGIITGTPTQAGTISSTVSATNSGGTGTATVTFTIIPAPPVITSPSTATGHVDEPFFYQIIATDTPTTGFPYGASNLPPGLTVDNGTGVISGTPTLAGIYPSIISVTNDGGTTTKIVTITITGVVPLITSPTEASGQQFQYFSYQITATGDVTSYSAIGLPAGLSINTASGLISGTPTVAGDFSVQISATAGDQTGTATLLLSIASAGETLIHFNQATFPAVSTNGSVTVTVDFLRATGDVVPITVDYSTSDGSAKAGVDYVATSGTLVSTGSNTQGSIIIQLIPQMTPAADKTFTVTLSNISHGTLGAPTQATVVISYPDLSTKLTNISTRGYVGTDQKVMIAGLIVSGQASKMVVIRGIGPSLTEKGVIGAIADPTLSLMDANGTQLSSNDDYAGLPAEDQGTLVANNLTPTDSREAALVATLPTGNYTAILRGKTNGFGLVEVYDITASRLSRFVNISTRAQVEAGDNGALIGGFIVQAPDNEVGTAQTVLIRAIGPSLSGAGIVGALADPTIDLYRGSELILSNDNWKSDNEAAIEATGLQPTNVKEAAILTTLEPGSYTAVIRGKNDTTGIALVEVYQMQ